MKIFFVAFMAIKEPSFLRIKGLPGGEWNQLEDYSWLAQDNLERAVKIF